MTTLQKLELSGIRLFKEDEIPQTIDFEPITLITGDNGVGKSTIIEALQFATIGNCPKELITIPSIWKKDKTNSKVSLFFNTANNDNYHLTLNATVDNAKNITGSLHDVPCELTIKESNGIENPVPIQSIYETIPNYFRTSPSILKNVIFCNQKNSLWPIEDKALDLKKKFDEIFDTNKYHDAITALKKTKSNLKKELNNTRIEGAEQKQRHITYQEHIQKIKDFNDEIINLEKKIEEKNIPFQEIQESLKIYNDLQPKIKKYEEKIQEKKGQLFSEEQTIYALKEKIPNLQPKSSFEPSLNSIQSEIITITETINSNKQKFDEFLQNQNKLTFEKGEIKTGIDEISKNLDEIKSAKDIYFHNLKEFKNKYSTDEFDSILHTKENSMKKAQNNLDCYKGQIKIDLDKKNEELTNLKASYAKEKACILNCENEIEKNQLDLTNIGEIDENIVKNAMIMKQEATESFIDFIRKEKTPETIEDEIEETKIKLESAEKELKSIEQNKIDSQKVEHFELQISQSKAKIETQLNIIKDRLNDPTIEAENLKKNIEEKITKLKKEIKLLKSNLSQINNDLFDVKYQLRQEQSSFEKSEKETKIVEDKILKIIFNNVDNFDNEFQSNENALNNENENLAILKNNLAFYNGYLEEAKNSHCCPLCKRKFVSEEECKNFIKNELDSFIFKIPNQIKDCELKIKEYQNRIKELKSITDDVKLYHQNNFTREEKINRIISLQDKELNLSEKFNEISEKITMNKEILEKYQSITENVIIIDIASQKIEKVTKQLDKIKEKIGDAFLSVDKIHDNEISLSEKVSNFQQKINELYIYKSSYLSKKNELEKQEYQAEQQYEMINSKYERKIKLVNSIDSLQKVIIEKDKIVKEMNEKIENLSQEKMELTESYNKRVEELENKRDEERSEYQTCFSLIEKINSSKKFFESNDSNEIFKKLNNLQIQFNKKEEELNKVNQIISNLLQKNKSLEENLSLLTDKKEDLLNQQNYYKRKELYDSINQELQNLIKEKSEKIGALSEIDIEELNLKYQNMEKELTILETNKKNYEKQIEQENEEKKKYEDSTKLYKASLIKEQLIMKSISDIKRYSEQLDTFILKYHDKKMDDINDTIQDLWRNIYFGHDIDSIAIRCEGEKFGNAQYNYRVVMIKNGNEMDMAKFCSAGQKQLASVIIRLALAQTFALSCPIIALDEPTTNLDNQNITNLAKELVKLYKEGMYNDKMHFQIIIITHNIDFMKTLVEEGMLDSFYQIIRFKNGRNDFSQIKKCKELNLINK